MRAILYYTDNAINPQLLTYCQKRILEHKPPDMRLICVSQAPLEFGENICVGAKPKNHQSMYEQIVVGLEKIYDAAVVFFCEHDILYPPGYFDYVPEDLNAYSYVTEGKYYLRGGKYRRARGKTLSTLATNGVKALAHFHQRLYRLRTLGMPKGGWTGSEPGLGRQRSEKIIERNLEPNLPLVDIRHGQNLSTIYQRTGNLDRIPFWPSAGELTVKLGLR